MRALLRIGEKKKEGGVQTFSVCLHIHIFATSIGNLSTANDRKKKLKMAIFVVMLSMLQFSIFQEFCFLCECVVCVCWQRHDFIADKRLARPDFRFECGFYIFDYYCEEKM
jgi:hypothetical protein